MTKVSIISGFLGAGKTTFIKQLLTKVFQNEKVVLIENEFGEIGIDGGFLKEAGIEITEMNSGCICCTLVGDFSEALQKVLAEYHPDRVIIEPSGVGKLSDVAKAVLDVHGEETVELDSKIAVVDAKKARVYMKNFGEFFANQVEHADTIVLSRTDSIKQAKLEECLHLLREHNAKAPIITTPWEQLEGEVIRNAITQEHKPEELIDMEEVHAHHHEHHHEHEHHEHHHHEGEECCCGHDHDHEHEHEHRHEHHEHHHHEGEECCCGHDHDHEHEHHHEHHEHHHHEGEECCCGHDHDHHHHHHDHDHHHHHHDHDHHHHHHDHECGCGHDHHGHHHADEVFTSWGVETVHKYDRADLEALLEALSETELYGTVLRAKGIISLEDNSWVQFDLVPEEYEIRDCAADYTGRLCVIGTDLKEDALKQAFHI